MPSLIPSSLWRQSGRLESAGPEVLHLSGKILTFLS